MSGGHFQYTQRHFEEIASEIERLVRDNDLPAVDGDPYRYAPDEPRGFGFAPQVLERFRVAAATCRRAAIMAQRVDWLVSADDGEDDFLRRWDEELDAHDRAQAQMDVYDNPPMLMRVCVEAFRDAGLLWFVNRMLHVFGWALVWQPSARELYPARTRFRGFDQDTEASGFERVARYLRDRAVELYDEADFAVEHDVALKGGADDDDGELRER